jgi:IS30 family transposase
MSNDHNAILDLWAAGDTAAVIADRLGLHRGTICNSIIRARDRGDERAASRPVGRRKTGRTKKVKIKKIKFW